jgi:hypothetical protein
MVAGLCAAGGGGATLEKASVNSFAKLAAGGSVRLKRSDAVRTRLRQRKTREPGVAGWRWTRGGRWQVVGGGSEPTNF